MRVVRMYSGNLAASQDWKKVEVEVDENDLLAILFEAGVDLETVPRYKIPSRVGFQLLTLEAEIMLKTTMVQSFAVDVEQVKKEIGELNARKSHVTEQLLAKLGASEDES